MFMLGAVIFFIIAAVKDDASNPLFWVWIALACWAAHILLENFYPVSRYGRRTGPPA